MRSRAPPIVRDVDLSSLAQAWRRRFEREAEDLERSAERRRAASRRIARVLADEFGAREVWLFGSLVWGRLHAGSDVDLAIRGIAPERYARALAGACEVAGEQVDLVPLESCAASLRDRIGRQGVRLDAR